MFDRLGRRDDETPFIVEYFNSIGVEVWSTVEGKQEFSSHVDKLINYIRFWQANGESQKTSIRVDTKHKQMIKEGLYRGGAVPFGYKLVGTGEYGKKGNELHKLAINEEEAKVVRKIFELIYHEGYGTHRIAQYLNDNNIPTRNGKKWGSTTINNIIRNPIYNGYLSYGKTSQKSGAVHRRSKDEWLLSNQISELKIIPDEMWEKVHEIRKSRSPFAVKNPEKEVLLVRPPSYGTLLFTGYIYCGYCGSSLSTTYHCKEWKRKDGTVRRTIIGKYRCNGKLLNKTKCKGQTTYGQKKIEGLVLKQVYKYLDNLEKVDFSHEIEKYKRELLREKEEEINKLQKANEENYKDLDLLNNEILKSLKGQSNFSPDRLSKLIEEKEKEIKDIDSKIEQLQKELQSKQLEVNDMIELKNTIPVWKEVFEKASISKKKMMLSQIIDKIVVYRDKIDVHVKIHLNQFINTSRIDIFGDVNKTMLGEH
ncbi:recombinase family protein [Caldanaerobius fijiensis]|uniref:recombinase family protein n=1 Tax=Caldanaerobius fijiensis TaxID=456330 RepID=UPI000933B71E|nr:recombinase family protein [Caldanaerobius fijiensis]